MADINVRRIAQDCYRGNTQFYSIAEQEQILRGRMEEILGGAVENKDDFRRKFQESEKEFFALVEELITINVSRTSISDLPFVEARDFGLGDKVEFKVKTDELYKVSYIATGMKPRRRQKIYNKKLQTQAFRMGVKIYEEFFDFITGQIDWADCIDRVSRSFNYAIACLASQLLFGAYKVENGGETFSGNYSDAQLLSLVRNVEAKTGKKVVIYGCGSALDNIIGSGAESDKQDKREYGYVRKFKGRDCVELPQVFDEDLNKMVIPENLLLIVPEGEKIIRVGFEGKAFVFENTDPGNREDMQVEFSFARMLHMGVLVARSYGAYEIEA